MTIDRRRFLGVAAAGVLGCASVREARCAPEPEGRLEAVAFDGLVVFDPRPVFGRAREVVGERAPEFVASWRQRLFEYQWLRGLGERYADFLACSDAAVRYAGRALEVELSDAAVRELSDGFLELEVWPDVPPVLEALRARGVRLGLLANMTPAMLAGGVERAGLGDVFEQVLSTERVRSFKPSPAAYRLGVEAFGLDRGQIGFAAFAGWDAAGARWFGYPTLWINRLGAPREELGLEEVPTGVGAEALLAFVGE